MENKGEVITVTRRDANSKPPPTQIPCTAMGIDKILNYSILQIRKSLVLSKGQKERLQKTKQKIQEK